MHAVFAHTSFPLDRRRICGTADENRVTLPMKFSGENVAVEGMPFLIWS